MPYNKFNSSSNTFDTNVNHLLTGHDSSVGVPSTWNILVNCSRSDSPGKNGTRNNNSANIHPTAHISTHVPYCLAPYNNSGDLIIKNKSISKILIGVMYLQTFHHD